MFTEIVSDARVTCVPLPEFQMALPFPLRGTVAVLCDGARQWLAAAPYSSTGRSALILISLPDGAVEKVPLDDEGALAIVAGADGCLYLGTLTGRLLCYDVRSRALTELARPGGVLTAGCWQHDRCYLGCQDGAVLAWDPADGELRTVLPSGTGDVLSLLPTPDGCIAALIASDELSLLRIDRTGAITSRPLPGLPAEVCALALPNGDLLLGSQVDGRCYRLAGDQLLDMPALPNGDAFFVLGLAGDVVLAAGRFTGSIYRLTEAHWRCLGTPMPNDPLHFVVLPDLRLAGVTHQGRLVQSTPDWQMYALARLPNRAPAGLHLRALGMGPDRRLYFSSRGNARLGRWDLEEDEIAELHTAAPFPAEIGVFGIAGERLYMGFSAPCGVMTYYPELPYRLLENPKLVGLVGDGQIEIAGRMIILHGRLYFAASGHAGEGALVCIEPGADTITTFPGVLPGQQLTSVIADRMNHLLILGGRCAGGTGQVGCWSPDTQTLVTLASPFPDAEFIQVWAAEGGRAFITDGGERLAILSTTTGEVLERGHFPLGIITSLVTTQHGEFYGLAGGWLFHFDPVDGTVHRLCEASGEYLTEVRRGRFAFTRDGRLYSAQIW